MDAIFVGPVDLRANMRKPDGSEASDADFEATIDRIITIGKKTGAPTGMHVMNPEAALQRARQGMQFIAVASELRMMTAKAEDFLKTLKPEAAAKDLARY